MIYPPRPWAFGHLYCDRKILIALKQAGIIDRVRVSRRSELTKSKQTLDEALAGLFSLALRPPIFAKLTGQCQGSRDHLLALRDATPWARRGWTVTWFKFILGIVYARINWITNPTFPYDTEQHAATARSIDTFLDAAKDLWSPVHFSFKAGPPGNNKPRGNEHSEEGEAVSPDVSPSTEISGDIEFDMGSLLAALTSDTAADDVIRGIERMVIEDDEDDED
ncbi:hypothetical protein GGR53DRAFT_462636 [Hypoxylon sp. FL1150]|nr:hypothetical protein GGR53DRAFT_462636 [Hypoxylon sp. FL1150]